MGKTENTKTAKRLIRYAKSNGGFVSVNKYQSGLNGKFAKRLADEGIFRVVGEDKYTIRYELIV